MKPLSKEESLWKIAEVSYYHGWETIKHPDSLYVQKNSMIFLSHLF